MVFEIGRGLSDLSSNRNSENESHPSSDCSKLVSLGLVKAASKETEFVNADKVSLTSSILFFLKDFTSIKNQHLLSHSTLR